MQLPSSSGRFTMTHNVREPWPPTFGTALLLGREMTLLCALNSLIPSGAEVASTLHQGRVSGLPRHPSACTVLGDGNLRGWSLSDGSYRTALCWFNKLKKMSLHEEDHAKTSNWAFNDSEVGSEFPQLEFKSTLCDLGQLLHPLCANFSHL